jgi:3-oxoacyl-[acyl-carrier protein] reductase
MLANCMALELGPKVRVNGIGLGLVESPLVHEVFSSDQLEEAIKSIPLGRVTSMEETAAFIRLLASESTSFITGQTIMFNGGETMR